MNRDLETSFITRLKALTAANFTARMEGMLRDLQGSAGLMSVRTLDHEGGRGGIA